MQQDASTEEALMLRRPLYAERLLTGRDAMARYHECQEK